MIFERVPAQFPATGRAKLAFIAEAPSYEEVERGVPLVGPSGRVFNAMLRAANIDRDECLITNVFDEQADDNDVSRWLADEARLNESAARLADEISRTQPNVIVPLGNTALHALTGHGNISAFRGNVIPATRIVPGAKLVPTLHPALVIRQWQMFPVVIGDLIKAATEGERGPKIEYPDKRLMVEPTVAEVEAWCERCKAAGLLSVDIETGWGQITNIGLGTSDEAMCIPFVDLRRPNKSYWATAEEELRAVLAIKDVLESPVPKLGQNFIYDLQWLYGRWGINVNNYLHDTRLMHHALYPELPKSLEFMQVYARQGAWKHMGARYSKEKRDD